MEDYQATKFRSKNDKHDFINRITAVYNPSNKIGGSRSISWKNGPEAKQESNPTAEEERG